MDEGRSNQALTAVLVDFARTLGTDFSIQKILDLLVTSIVDMLPVTGVGVMLMGLNQELHFLACSNSTVMTLETLQNELLEGPCLAAYQSGEAVLMPDLRDDRRFPRFTPRAAAAGLAAVFTFPLRLDDHRLGALDLYRDAPGPLDEDEVTVAQILADVAAGYLVNAQARVDAAAATAMLRHQSLHDPLTGLPNRILLVELLDRAMNNAHLRGNVVAVLFIDLDGFKAVNDSFGHHVGDQLLGAVAQRLSGLLRPGDTLSRLGGDEFVILCEHMSSSADAEPIARRITAALSEPFDLPERRIEVSGSVGVAYSGSGQAIPEVLLRNADWAMYQAKGRGGSQHQISDPRARLAADNQADLERDLNHAQVLDQFFLLYQPIVAAEGGATVAAEALLRWNHPGRGLVMPDQILPRAERTGAITDIGEWVLRKACRDFGRWQASRAPGVAVVAVNVSPRQVMGPAFARTVDRVLKETGVNPESLYLEVTETLFLADADRALSVLKGVKDLGVRLSLDDFGTGYSSLSYLRHFPVDTVKIDRSFTANVVTDSATESIVHAVVDLAHVLKMEVIAEGVETVEQQKVMTEMGADYLQGFHFSRPVPVAGLVNYAASG